MKRKFIIIILLLILGIMLALTFCIPDTQMSVKAETNMQNENTQENQNSTLPEASNDDLQETPFELIEASSVNGNNSTNPIDKNEEPAIQEMPFEEA